MNMFKQQQRRGAPAVKHFTPFGLFIQQRGVEQVECKIGEHRRVAADKRQRVVLTLPQQLVWVLHQQADHFEDLHYSPSALSRTSVMLMASIRLLLNRLNLLSEP